MIPIKYVGKRERYEEGTYGSHIIFVKGETQNVPYELGIKLLRHPDVYERGEEGAKVAAIPEKAEQNEDELQYSRDAVVNMDKDSLELFVKTHFNQDLDKRKKLETLRSEAIMLIDQYGLPV